MLRISVINQGCLFTSCFNGGFCLPDKEKQPFSCFCLPPWTGDRCQARSGNNYAYIYMTVRNTIKNYSNYFLGVHAWPSCFDKSCQSLADLLRRLQNMTGSLSKMSYNRKVV